MFESIVKKYMTYILIGIILIYHSLQIFIPDMIQKDVSSLINIIEWLVLISFALLSFDSKIVHKFVLKSNYIGGSYSGESFYIDTNNLEDKTKKGRNMEFDILQTLIKIEIRGLSKAIDKDINFDTSWKGYFFKKDIDSYFFALEVDYGSQEFGILKLSFTKNNDEFIGFYYSGSNTSSNQKIIFKRKEIEK